MMPITSLTQLMKLSLIACARTLPCILIAIGTLPSSTRCTRRHHAIVCSMVLLKLAVTWSVELVNVLYY